MERYTRIWCAFELFCVEKVLPLVNGRFLEIALVREKGVISLGDATNKTMETVGHLMANVHCAAAEATVSVDMEMIWNYMQKEGVTFEDLDDILRHIVHRGLAAVRGRRCGPILIAFSVAYVNFILMVVSINIEGRTVCPTYSLATLLLILPVFCSISCLAFSAHCGSGGSRDSWRIFGRLCSSVFLLIMPALIAQVLILVRVYLVDVGTADEVLRRIKTVIW